MSKDSKEPTEGSALCFRIATLPCIAIMAIMAIFAMVGGTAAASASPSPLTPEAACAQIREAVHKVATAERNQALALHLMADGKPTPMVQTRLTELQAQIGDLREVLRRARKAASRHHSDSSDCISMGFQSLTDAENVSRQIQDIVMGEGGPLPHLKSGESGGQRLPVPPLQPSPSPEE